MWLNFRRTLILFPLLLSLSRNYAALGHTAGLGSHVGEAYRLTRIAAPKIDGQLDDSAWENVKPISGFIQIRPSRGNPATDDTEVYITYDANHLYLAFRCYDANPEKLVSRLTRRGRGHDSDVISFFVDPQHDHRTGYKFATTPAGIQQDNYRYDDTQIDADWRGIWWAETQIDDLGWTAEFKIPFRNFRFPTNHNTVWGFDIERLNRRKNEVTIWRQMSQAGARTRMSDLGHLVGFANIEAAKPFEISSYLLGAWSLIDKISIRDRLRTGLNLQYTPTGWLKTHLTLNPDFAHVEADQLKINLTRFRTRFPEKRPFFVEGNSFFETPLDLFFSRRVGSLAPILWGGKTTGKSGKYSMGLLGVQTGRFNPFQIESKLGLTSEAWYSAIRIKRDIFNRSSIGYLFVNKEQGDNYNRQSGMDIHLALGKTSHISAQYAKSFQPIGRLDRDAFRIEFEERNYQWHLRTLLERIEPEFEINETGFLRKEEHRGWQRANAKARYYFQGLNWQPFIGLGGELSHSLFTDAYFLNWEVLNPAHTRSSEFETNLFGWKASINAGLEFTSSILSHMRMIYRRSREIELTDVFDANHFELRLHTNRAKPIAARIKYRASDFYNFVRLEVDKQRQLSLASTVRPLSNVSIDFLGDYALSLDSGQVVNGRFLATSLRITYLFTRDTFVRCFAQAGRQRTAFKEILIEEDYLVNLLLGWEYSPKSSLFVAYNEDWHRSEDHPASGTRLLMWKINYLWNL